MASLKKIAIMVADAFDADDRKHVDRWLARDDAEELWKRVLRARSELGIANMPLLNQEGALLIAVIVTRRAVENFFANETAQEERDRRKAVLRQLRKSTRDYLKAIDAKPPALVRANTSLLHSVAELNLQLIEPPRLVTGKSKRRSKLRDRPQVEYARQIGNLFHDRTGKWRDADVAELVEIAFEEPIAERTIRNWRRKKS